MKKLSGFLKKAFEKQIDGTGLAVFRITYSIVLLCEIAQMFYFRKLIFDAIPNIEKSEISFAVPIILWFISVVFILFGLYTRFFSILNYLLGLILIGTASNFEYHMFYAYMGINFLIIFLPVSTCCSLDRLLLKLKYSSQSFFYNPSKNVSQLYYFILPLIAIGFVYFDSVFYKLSSSMWINGLGSWLPSSLPMITHFNNSWLLNQEYLIKSIGWFTLLFETLFLFVFFRKKWRIVVFLIGMILHLGILLQFPIPWFALGVCTIYILLVPVSFWKNHTSKNKDNFILTVYFDGNSFFENKALIFIKHFDWFDKIQIKSEKIEQLTAIDNQEKKYYQFDVFIQMLKKTILFPIAYLLNLPVINSLLKKKYDSFKNKNSKSYENQTTVFIGDKEKVIFEGFTFNNLKYKFIISLIIFLTILQSTMLYGTWLMNDLKSAIGFNNSTIDKSIYNIVKSYSKISKFTLGITGHPVFSNEIHFDGYNHIVAVTYLDKNNNEIWLPIINKNGQPDFYIYGANWVNWTFRINEQHINLEKMSKGIQRYTAFWAYKNKVDLTNAKFILKVKKISIPKHWEKDFLNKQIANPWQDGGFVEWKETKFSSNIKNIESL